MPPQEHHASVHARAISVVSGQTKDCLYVNPSMFAFVGEKRAILGEHHGDFPVHERFWFFLVQVSTNQFSLFAAFASVFMAIDRACEDEMHTSLPGSSPLSSNVGSPHGSGHNLDGMGTRSGNTMDEKLDALPSKFVHFETQIAQVPTLTTWMSRMDSHITKHLGIWRPDSQRWNIISAASLHVCARSRHMLPLHQMHPVRHDPGLGSHGPGSSDDNRNTRRRLDPASSTEDERSRLANNTSKELQNGSIPFRRSPTCWHVTNLSEFIAKPVPCQSGLFLKHEANAKTLLLDIRMMVFLMQLTVPSAAPTQLSQCVNPDQLKTGRMENNLCRCGKSWLTSLKFSFLMEMTKVFLSSQRSMLFHKPSASKIAETELENHFFKLAPLGSGQTFTPDLSVPGIPHEVLQRVLSQANRPHV